MTATYAAVVLAGGTAARLGGVDKASVELDGRPLVAWALDAVADAVEVVVVGDDPGARRAVTTVREDPPHGGPVAALLAGRDALRGEVGVLAVLACDMPRLTTGTFARLRAAAADRDGAVLVGPDGRRVLAMVLTTGRLDDVRPEHGDGMALHRLLARLDLADVRARGDEHRDVDTWADLRQLDR